MKKFIKTVIIIFAIIISIFILIIIGSFINHKVQLSKENELFVPPGKLVKVNGHKVHVYTEGNGEETFVFMSGGGTSSPLLDFKSLYSLLSDKYKVVVVEKAGYGFSEVTNTDRDIDTILSETREALVKSGLNEGPYILFPHSMSGIEALRWAEIYPDEIKAIVGLDMAVPAAYENIDINMPLIQLGALAASTGITRLVPNISESDAIKHGTLTEEEKELYEVVFYRRTSTENMVNEVKMIKTNAHKVADAEVANVPMLLFSSNGEGTGMAKETWYSLQNNFINQMEHGKLIKLDASHYIHNVKYERIAEESEKFINRLPQVN